MAGRHSHLNPVSVSSWRAPWWAATFPSRVDDTTLDTVSRSGPEVTSPSSQSPSSAPTSSPVNWRTPEAPIDASGTSTATRSASGSSASPRSAPTAAIRSASIAVTPGSSGLGNATVGKSGSGEDCSGTGWTSP